MKCSPLYLQRSGAVLAIALTMVLVIGLLLGSLLQRVVQEQRQVRVRQHQWQAQWLARAAVERARAQVAANPAYDGEVWKPELTSAAGAVSIKIETAEGTERRTVSVVAIYPAEHPFKARFNLNQTLPKQ